MTNIINKDTFINYTADQNNGWIEKWYWSARVLFHLYLMFLI